MPSISLGGGSQAENASMTNIMRVCYYMYLPAGRFVRRIINELRIKEGWMGWAYMASNFNHFRLSWVVARPVSFRC